MSIERMGDFRLEWTDLDAKRTYELVQAEIQRETRLVADRGSYFVDPVAGAHAQRTVIEKTADLSRFAAQLYARHTRWTLILPSASENQA